MTKIREDLLSIYHQMDDPTFNKKKLLQHGVYFNGKKYTELDLFTPRGQFILRLLDSLEKKKLAQKKQLEEEAYLFDSNNSNTFNQIDNSMELNYQLFEKTNNLLYNFWNNIGSARKFIQNNLLRSLSYFGKFVYNNPLISLGFITILTGIYYHKKILPIILTAIYQNKNLGTNEYPIEGLNNYLYLDDYGFGENNDIDNNMKLIDSSWLILPAIASKQPNSLEKKTPINSIPHNNFQNRKNCPCISITNINLEHNTSGEAAFLLRTNSLQSLIDLLKRIIKINGYTLPNNLQNINLPNSLTSISELTIDHNSSPSYPSQNNNQEFTILIYIQQNTFNLAIRLPSGQKFLLQLKKTKQFYTGTLSDSLMPNPNTNVILNDLLYPSNYIEPLESHTYIASPLTQLTLDYDHYYEDSNQLLQTALFDFNVMIASIRTLGLDLKALMETITALKTIIEDSDQSLRDEIDTIHCKKLIKLYIALVQTLVTIDKLKNKISLLEEITIDQGYNLIEEIHKIKKDFDPLLETFVFSEISTEMFYELRMSLIEQIEESNESEQNDFNDLSDNYETSENENNESNTDQITSEQEHHLNENTIFLSNDVDLCKYNILNNNENNFNNNFYQQNYSEDLL